MTSRTEIYPDVGARCVRCSSAAHLVEGDGPPICRLCISFFGEAARDPFNVDDAELAALREFHGDVVVLAEVEGKPGLEWRWTAPWPGVAA